MKTKLFLAAVAPCLNIRKMNSLLVSSFLFEDALLGVNQLSPAPNSIVVRGESPHSTPKLGVPEYAP